MTAAGSSSMLATARALSRQGDLPGATDIMLRFAREVLHLDCSEVHLTPDGYSLNSLNGILHLASPFQGESRLFFKYHQEEDETKGVAEYYNSKLLEEAGLPVDVPLAARHDPGEQILLYRVRTDPRLADVCRALEHGDQVAFSQQEVLEAQRQLDRAVGAKYLETLRLAPRSDAASEPLHQLFYLRLVDDPKAPSPPPGGRRTSFYHDAIFAFPGLDRPLTWEQLAGMRWRVNGITYSHTLGELFDEATRVLAPSALPDQCPVVLGHGDAHNANVWIERHSEGRACLAFFDPAFAGAALPALLAEIKATFHNIFAHPDWLYHADEAASQLQAHAVVDGNVLDVTLSWDLHPLRMQFLESKIEYVWRPLLAAMRGPLEWPAWETYIRLALFCCPTLVMNLVAGAERHNPVTSLTGLAIAVMCGSPGNLPDVVSTFIERIAPYP